MSRQSAEPATTTFDIWALRHIRRLLPDDAARMLACSMVATRLDYCNSLLHGSSYGNITKLQRVQNSLARVVLQAPRLTHAAPLLKSLHWLPIAQRITFKMTVITYKVRKTSTPTYLHNLLSNRTTSSSMSLRSSHQPLLALYVAAELSAGVVRTASLRPKYGTNFHPMFSSLTPVNSSVNVYSQLHLMTFNIDRS